MWPKLLELAACASPKDVPMRAIHDLRPLSMLCVLHCVLQKLYDTKFCTQEACTKLYRTCRLMCACAYHGGGRDAADLLFGVNVVQNVYMRTPLCDDMVHT